MRIRAVKPCFFKDEELADLGPYAMLLFEGLWCMADGEGRLEDRPRRIRIEILPYFDVDVDDILNQLHEGGFIRRYEVGGEKYIQVVKFKEHQRITGKEAETPSRIPEESSEKQQGNNGETTETTGREGNKEGKVSSSEDNARAALALPASLDTAEFREVWDSWRKHLKAKGGRCGTPEALKRHLAKLETLGSDEACRWLNNAIFRGWQAPYEPKDDPPKRGSPKGTVEALLQGSRIHQMGGRA